MVHGRNVRLCSRVFILSLLTTVTLAPHLTHGQTCLSPKTVDFPIRMFYCEQPFFLSFVPKSEGTALLDNVCVTSFPLPDDPNTIISYNAAVFCDGSVAIDSTIVTSVGKGTNQLASPMATYRDYAVGYVGCNTYVGYRCPLFGDPSPPYVFGITFSCSPLGLSCLRKVDEVIKDAGLPQQDMYILPMKLPNRCVVQTACTLPPNPFYNKLGPSVGLVY